MTSEKKNERLIERFGKSYTGGEMIFVEDDEAKEVFMVVQGLMVKSTLSVNRVLSEQLVRKEFLKERVWLAEWVEIELQ